MLSAIDDLYQEHLYAMDSLRQEVQLRSYGQRDPLVEYKQEAYGLFSDLMAGIKDSIAEGLFKYSIATPEQLREREIAEANERKRAQEEAARHSRQLQAANANLTTAGERQAAPRTIRNETPKVGRNDPCPCGSGKKYKSCCGR